MGYILYIKPSLKKKLKKLVKKDPKQVDIILRKVDEILNDPNRYKNLRAPLEDWKRVHIDKNFILCFSVDENRMVVTLEDYDHHDKIYKHS